MKTSMEVEISRLFPIKNTELFKFFVEAELLEKWAYPDGFTLKIPQLEARPNGAYLWEHANDKGRFTSYGHFKEFSPGRKLVMLDETIKDQAGKVLYENQECSFSFKDHDEGTELTLQHKGFNNQKDRDECEQSWNQCLGRLEGLLTRATADRRPKGPAEYERFNSVY